MKTVQVQTVYDINRVSDSVYSVQQVPQCYDVEYTPYAVISGGSGGGMPDVELTTAMFISGHRAVCVMSDGLVHYADADTVSTAGILGITTAAAGTGELIPIRTAGELQHNGWIWSIGDPVFVGSNGMLTQSPAGSEYVAMVGIAISEDTINIEVQQPIFIG